ncbi:hypothetical protein Q428_00625 [Fervidicella metallireducens AeB]|uniref:ATP synthase subunit delta n=1 Tax=Fervidicella metallireducens AeB TaxID=1403537 RepID=A0A017RYX5_9CLOT|nr:F0F1 ATP synthase subunit delta [Fervidicella metallireducens]EYE89882.1 hypothetical protein Q428_00625 [Fervidicella metallireducens AeB]
MHVLEVASRRYGNALFEIAIEKNKLELFLEELKDVRNILTSHEELRSLLHHPNIPFEQKKKVIFKIFKGKIEDEIVNLLIILIENNRISDIELVYYDYKYLVYKYKRKKIAYVTTAVEMTAEEVEALRQRLSDKYQSEIEVQNIVDPEIIGGVHLKIGDHIIDSTIKGQLTQIRKRFLQEYREVRS